MIVRRKLKLLQEIVECPEKLLPVAKKVFYFQNKPL